MIRVSFWTAVFLVVLRLAIGWHFYFEGASKIKSAYAGKAEVNSKPFSSETFFRESETPLGRLIKQRIGDPDQELIERLTLKPKEEANRFPERLRREWDEYFGRFAIQYKLTEDQKQQAQAKLDKAKADFARQIEGLVDPAAGKDAKPKDPLKPKPADDPKGYRLKVKRKAPGGNASADFEADVTIAERLREFQAKLNEIREVYEKRNTDFGRDVEGVALRVKKDAARDIAKELQKEVDDATKAMKDGLAAVLDTRVTAYSLKVTPKDDAALLAMLTPMAGGKNPLSGMWDDYGTYVKENAPKIGDQDKIAVDTAVEAAKKRFDNWLEDKDAYTGSVLVEKEVADWRKAYDEAKKRLATIQAAAPPKEAAADAKSQHAHQLKDAEDEVKALTGQMSRELKALSDSMRGQVGASLLGDERARGYADKPDDKYFGVVPKNVNSIEFIDWITRWFLAVVGGLLLLGLFTRLSCLAGAGFLALTIATQPALPWLPTPPNQEGTYLFVNKNAIELIALLALMTTRSGKWAGLDGLVGWVFSRKSRKKGR